MTEAAEDKCVVCAKPIPAEALKCTVCGEFQSSRSRILLGLDLKSLMTLLPLLTLIYAFLSERVQGEQSDLRIANVRCDSASITVFASNAGNRSAVIKRAGFAAGDDPAGEFDLPAQLQQLVFEAGASRLTTFNVNR